MALSTLDSLPRGMTITDTGTALHIERRWWHWSVVVMIPFALIWNGFIIFFVTMILRDPKAPWFALAFLSLHATVGAGLVYYVLAAIFNRTLIDIDTNRLSVRHTPLPWFGSHDFIDPASVDQLFVQQKLHRTKNGRYYTYSVGMVMLDGSRLTLIKGLPKSEQARFIEQRLEEFLGLEDRAVEGEFNG